MFRIVDGSREMCFRNGKQDIKHLYSTGEFSMYVPVLKQIFRRWDKKYSKYRYYKSAEEAKADTDKHVEADVFGTVLSEVRAIGWPCYVIEVYIPAESYGTYDEWQSQRYEYLEKNGILQKVDVLGPYPADGKYVFCIPVLDKDGRACEPRQEHLDEVRKRLKFAQQPEQLEVSIKNWHEREARLHEESAARMADNLYQYHGLAMRRVHHGVVGKPILKEKKHDN